MSWIKLSADESLRIDCPAISCEIPVAIICEDIETAHQYASPIAELGINCRTFRTTAEFLASDVALTVWCVIGECLPCGSPNTELVRLIKAETPGCQVILTSVKATIFSVVEAMKSGASAVLEKPVTADALSIAIKEARRIAHTDLFTIFRVPQLRRKFASISEGEKQVLDRLLLGIPHKRIASELDISLRTVELRKSRIMRKLGLESFAELIQLVTMIEFYEVVGPRRLA